MNRRDFLASAAAAGATGALAPFPALADGRVSHVLRAAPAEAALMGPGEPKTAVSAFGGGVPGPEIRLKRDTMSLIRVENGLSEETSVHWHGIRIDNAMDGVSGFTQAPIAPGDTFDYRFRAPDAGTYWYHSHHRSWEQVARGLYGPLIVEEDDPVGVDQDLTFLADDWLIDGDGVLNGGFGNVHDAAHGGRLGNWLTVNGETLPTFTARPGERLRLRCLSAANARVMAFDFGRLRPWIIAVDGQPLAAPRRLEAPLTLAPAQRADLLIDVATGAEDVAYTVDEVSSAERYPCAKFAVSGTPIRTRAPENTAILPANPLPTSLDMSGAITVDLLMEGGAMGGMRQATYQGQMFDMRRLVMEKGQAWALNGVAGRPADPLVRVPRGRTVIVDMINETAWPHGMHLHGHHFQVVERNGERVTEAPWRDTELVRRGERTKVAFIADNPGKWLFHCHMLEHHMAGMGTWIQVL